MSHRDHDDGYYRNNTVDLNTSEVKVTPRSDTGHYSDREPRKAGQYSDRESRTPGQYSHRESQHHSDTPIVTDHKRGKAHISPRQPRIPESEVEGREESRSRDYTSSHVTQKDTIQHVYPKKGPGPGLSLEKTLSDVEEEFVKRGLLSSPPLSPGQRDLAYQSSLNNPQPQTNTLTPRGSSPEGQRKKANSRPSTYSSVNGESKAGQRTRDNTRPLTHTTVNEENSVGQTTRDNTRPPTHGTVNDENNAGQKTRDITRPLTHTTVPRERSPEHERVVYLIRSPRKSVVNSADSMDTAINSKQSTLEDELKSLSTTPRYSHEDLGRIVSPPDSDSEFEQSENLMSNVDDDMKSMLLDTDSVKRDMVSQESRRKDLQTRLRDIEEDVKDLNVKLATLRVKLGVANANTNVSKTESEQLRKKFQETQIQMARLEERSKSCNTELERLKDPNNPDSNVNMKKIVVNDRKEIRRLRNELEGIRSERSEARKQMDEQDERIEMLKHLISNAQDQLVVRTNEYEEAKVRSEMEEKEREEMEEKCDDLVKGKEEFESEFAKLSQQLESTLSGTSSIIKVSEQYKSREQDLLTKIATADKKLRDVLTEIEQQKNRSMPQRTACSIKYHQYRMSKTSGLVTETTPHVIVTSDPKGSLGASGYLGKTVVSQKVATSLPSRNPGTKQQSKGKSGSLPSKR